MHDEERNRLIVLSLQVEKRDTSKAIIDVFRHMCTTCHYVWHWLTQDSLCRHCGSNTVEARLIPTNSPVM